MKFAVAIGAPSLTGKGAHELDGSAIAGLTFPCLLLVENHMPQAAVFPEMGVELGSVFAGEGASALVPFPSEAQLRRLLRSASEIADLNGFALALSVSEPEPATDAELTEQVISAAPEVEQEVREAGGVDAAATLADHEASHDDEGAPEGQPKSEEAAEQNAENIVTQPAVTAPPAPEKRRPGRPRKSTQESK